jgi:hypothetical protein
MERHGHKDQEEHDGNGALDAGSAAAPTGTLAGVRDWAAVEWVEVRRAANVTASTVVVPNGSAVKLLAVLVDVHELQVFAIRVAVVVGPS